MLTAAPQRVLQPRGLQAKLEQQKAKMATKEAERKPEDPPVTPHASEDWFKHIKWSKECAERLSILRREARAGHRTRGSADAFRFAEHLGPWEAGEEDGEEVMEEEGGDAWRRLLKTRTHQSGDGEKNHGESKFP